MEKDPPNLRLRDNDKFSHQFVLSSDMFTVWNKDLDFAVLRLPKTEFTMARIPVSCDMSLTEHIHTLGYILGHLQAFVVTPGEVTILEPEKFYINSLSTPGYSGAAIISDGQGKAIGFMCGNHDASSDVNSHHQAYSYRFDQVVLATKRRTSPTKNSSPAKQSTDG